MSSERNGTRFRKLRQTIAFDDAGRIMIDGKLVVVPPSHPADTGDDPFRIDAQTRTNKNCVDVPIRAQAHDTSTDSRSN
jgi:hypothetical protein